MRYIFMGFLFVFLDFNINIGASQIGLIPDFIGYIFIYLGLGELTDLNPRFEKARPFATVMAGYTGVLYLLALMGIGTGEVLGFILGLASTLISLYISYNIVMGIKEYETQSSRFLNAAGLYTAWTVLVILTLGSYLLFIIPILNWICIIAGLLAGIVFLVSFNKTKRLYYGMG